MNIIPKQIVVSIPERELSIRVTLSAPMFEQGERDRAVEAIQKALAPLYPDCKVLAMDSARFAEIKQKQPRELAIAPSEFLCTDGFARYIAENRIPRPPGTGWRMHREETIGQINGLPETRGALVATNGVLCFIRQAKGHFLGHLDFFVPDPRERSEPSERKERKPRKEKSAQAASGLKQSISDLLKELNIDL